MNTTRNCFGTIIFRKTEKSPLAPVGAGGPTLRFLCDGAARPNPGDGVLVVHDGRRYLPVPRRRHIGSYGAVYAAVAYALARAVRRKAAHVEISLCSVFVWRQIVGEEPCVELIAELERVRALASRIPRLEWVLVAPEFKARGALVRTRRSLRRLALNRVR